MSRIVTSIFRLIRALAPWGLLLAGENLFAEKLVMVSSVADSPYAEHRAASNPPPVETYVFAKGTFFSGVTHDNTLERMPFMRIAETLAYDLRRQNYYPTRDFKSADLVIVVHWGVTRPNDTNASLVSLDPNILIDAMTGIDEAREAETGLTLSAETARAQGAVAAAETNYLRTASDVSGLYERNQNTGRTNAQLLGFTNAINKENNESLLAETDAATTLRQMSNEERYFIILVAYDGAGLRTGKKKRLWTSRMSIRSGGVNFVMALDRMSNAAAKFHGTHQVDLAWETASNRPGTVKVGDLKVINDSAEKKP